MLLARKDIALPDGSTLKRGDVVPDGTFSEPEPYVRMGKLWRLDDEALEYLLKSRAEAAEKTARNKRK